MVAGLPWVDNRGVEDIGGLISAPLIAVEGPVDPEPWGGLSCASR